MLQPFQHRCATTKNDGKHAVRRVRYGLYLLGLLPLCTGCAVGAGAQLAAADALDALVQNLHKTSAEYHREVRSADHRRRAAAIDAFVQRVRDSRDDNATTVEHVSRFNEALDRLGDDADTERTRRDAVRDNLQTVGEIAEGLRRLGARSLAVQNMTLQRFRNYVTSNVSNGPTTEKP